MIIQRNKISNAFLSIVGEKKPSLYIFPVFFYFFLIVIICMSVSHVFTLLHRKRKALAFKYIYKRSFENLSCSIIILVSISYSQLNSFEARRYKLLLRRFYIWLVFLNFIIKFIYQVNYFCLIKWILLIIYNIILLLNFLSTSVHLKKKSVTHEGTQFSKKTDKGISSVVSSK